VIAAWERGILLRYCSSKTVVDRPLATRIEDDYVRWKSHPDYGQWTADPFRPSVVLGTIP